MHVKTVNVTNPRNVLVQIPSFVIANWGIKLGSNLEVFYNEDKQSVTIRPTVQQRSSLAQECNGLVSAAEA